MKTEDCQECLHYTIEVDPLKKIIYYTIILVLFVLLSQGCTHNETKLAGSSTSTLFTKLRVFVQPLQTDSIWKTSYPAYAEITLKKVAAVWQETGIYEVISIQEAASVVGPHPENLDWFANNAELARNAAIKVRAAYAMMVERKMSGYNYYWETTLINALTGRIFKVSMYVPGGSQQDYQPVIKASYDQIFRDAREDILTSALRITQNIASAKKTPIAAPLKRDLDFSKIVEEQKASGDRVQIAVYDFRTAKKNQVIALILSEALRQELLNLGKFKLVSHESTTKILEEMSLQMSGLVDQQQAIQAGKGLAAKQIVIGQYENLGGSSILQVKRIDVKLQQTLGISTLRCLIGQEDDLLKKTPELARELAIDK
jgi:hypothetical protein